MGLLDLIFPKKCLECGTYGTYICRKCIDRVRDGRWSGQVNFSVFRYEGVVKKAILALKYKFSYGVVPELACYTAERLVKRGFKVNAVLVPIPLHKTRKNWRGFNQSLEVGKVLSKEMNWGIAPNLLSKNINTKSQVGLGSLERGTNLVGAFEVNPTIEVPRNSQIIVFDDVYTTGSTMREAVGTLKAIGLGRVFGLTIAAN